MGVFEIHTKFFILDFSSVRIYSQVLFHLMFISGGFGGLDSTMNGKGGWSYYNPKSVIKVIEPNAGLPKCAERSDLSTKNDKGVIMDNLKNIAFFVFFLDLLTIY